MSTVRTLDVAVRANTQNFEAGVRRISTGLRSAILGMNAVAAAASGVEKSTLGMVNAVAIGFASGGPWGAAIAGAGIAVGVLIGKFKEAREEAEKAQRSQEAYFKRLDDFGTKSSRILDEIIFIRKEGREASPEELRLAHLAERRATAESLLQNLEWQFQQNTDPKRREDIATSFESWTNKLKMTIAEMEMLERLISLTKQRDELVEGLKDKPGKAIKGVKDELEGTSRAAEIAARSVSDFLSAVVVRGAEAKDVLQSIAQSLLSMGIQRGVNAAFGIATP